MDAPSVISSVMATAEVTNHRQTKTRAADNFEIRTAGFVTEAPRQRKKKAGCLAGTMQLMPHANDAEDAKPRSGLTVCSTELPLRHPPGILTASFHAV
jgi:hypothetical protein